MLDNPFKGGRSHKAPYKTTHIRVPESLKFILQKIVDLYKISVVSGDILASSQFIDEVVYYLKGYDVFAGILINRNKVISFDQYDCMQKEIKELSEANDRLKLSIEFYEQARQEIKTHLIEACKLKANTGGAIKKEIKKAIEILE